MKKIICFLITILSCSVVFAERIYKTFTVNGETVNRWVDTREANYEYDANGNEIYYKDSTGYEEWYEYDANGNGIHYKSLSGYEHWYEYEYDSNNRLIKKIEYTPI